MFSTLYSYMIRIERLENFDGYCFIYLYLYIHTHICFRPAVFCRHIQIIPMKEKKGKRYVKACGWKSCNTVQVMEVTISSFVCVCVFQTHSIQQEVTNHRTKVTKVWEVMHLKLCEHNTVQESRQFFCVYVCMYVFVSDWLSSRGEQKS